MRGQDRHTAPAGRKTANIDIRVDPELIGRIHDWIDEQQVVPPTFSAAVVYMIETFLDEEPQRVVLKIR